MPVERRETQYYECLYEPGLVGLFFVLGSCLEWPEVPTVFVLANFRPAFGTCDGIGSVGFIYLVAGNKARARTQRMGPRAFALLVDVVSFGRFGT